MKNQKVGIYVLVGILIPIFVKRMHREGENDTCHGELPPWLRKVTILNTDAVTSPRWTHVCRALPCHSNFMGLCKTHLSMSKLFCFADVSPTACHQASGSLMVAIVGAFRYSSSSSPIVEDPKLSSSANNPSSSSLC